MSPNINKMKDSNYLSKGDVEPPITLTITKCEKKDVSLESEPEEMKWVIDFQQDYKPMILNWTNINLIAAATGEEESENWAGKDITLYNDKTIMFMGKVTGGIRVNAGQPTGPAPTTMPTPEQQQDYNEAGHNDPADSHDIPF